MTVRCLLVAPIALAACQLPSPGTPAPAPAPSLDLPPPRQPPADDGATPPARATVPLELLEGEAPVAPVVTAMDLTAQPPCVDLPELRDVDDAAWTPTLRDLARHIPNDNPWHPQLSTAAHESTHVINSRAYEVAKATLGGDVNGFYLLAGCGVILEEPPTQKGDAAAFVPAALRGLRFAHYVEGTDWAAWSTYLFDEWVAYIHGAAAALELYAAGRWAQRTDAMAGQLELSIYALGSAMAAQAADPSYLPAHPTYLQFVAWNLVRALDQYRAGAAIAAMPSAEQATLYAELTTGAAGAPLRDFVVATWGDAFARRAFDLPAPAP